MNVRLFATVCWMAIASVLLGGCAGNPNTPSDFESSEGSVVIGDLPQMMLPGAARAEVKSLAMGAARSKGWTIAESTKDRLVVQYPYSQLTPTDLTTGASAPAVSKETQLEVTSYFIEQSGGVNVATKAELVTPAQGEQKPSRLDYTEQLRDSLTQSLTSLRTAWSEHRDRLARATPPAEGWKDPWSDDKPATPPDTGTIESTSQTSAATDPASPDPAPSSAPPAAPPPLQPAPLPIQSTAPRVAQATTAPRPAPEPRRPPVGAAPVVDASSALTTQPVSRTSNTSFDSLPEQSNMMSLPAARTPPAGAVTWAAYAEQFARQQGCQVTSEGAQLIESRRDGEIHKVPCAGSDSVLVQCRNGECRGLL